MDPNDRIKSLDIVKILIGIYSERSHIKRFVNDGKIYGKLQSYDYEDLMKIATETVNRYYLDALTENGYNGPPSKMRKTNDYVDE